MAEREDVLSATVRALADRMASRVESIAEDITEIVKRNIPVLDEPVATEILGPGIRHNVAMAVHSMRSEQNASDMLVPQLSIEYARLLAQRGLPISRTLRAYRLGLTYFVSACMEEFLATGQSRELGAELALLIFRRVSAYVDHAAEVLVVAYTEAREDWLAYKNAALASRVRTLLGDESADARTFQSELDGYPIGERHVAAILWADENIATHQRLGALAEVCERLGIVTDGGASLFVAHDESTAWVWLPIGAGVVDLAMRLDSTMGEVREGVWGAIGNIETGLSGFRLSHRQARDAQLVARTARTPRRRLTSYRDVAPFAGMCRNIDASRSWVKSVLGPLSLDDERMAEMRETIRTFLRTGGSFTETAELLALHRNTAMNRVRQTAELRGRELAEDHLDVEIALAACYWLTDIVLSHDTE
jgi:hypothetical protein